MRLGQQSYQCAVFTTSACDVCPSEYLGLPYLDEQISPKDNPCKGWEECIGSSSSTTIPDWWFIVRFKSSSSSTGEDKVYCVKKTQGSYNFCTYQSLINYELQQINSGPYTDIAECEVNCSFSEPTLDSSSSSIDKIYCVINYTDNLNTCLYQSQINYSQQYVSSGPFLDFNKCEENCNQNIDISSSSSGPSHSSSSSILEEFCLKSTEVQSEKHFIVSGPFSNEQCLIYSSSSSKKCTPVAVSELQLDGTYKVEIKCAEEISSSGSSGSSSTIFVKSSSSSTCLPPMPDNKILYCPDGTEYGTEYYEEDLNNCIWIKKQYITRECGSSSSCDENYLKCCLYGGLDRISLFNVIKPPQSSSSTCEQVWYCSPFCEYTCKDTRASPYFNSCPTFCCEPGDCVVNCEKTRLLNCLDCGGYWFINGIGSQEWIDQNCGSSSSEEPSSTTGSSSSEEPSSTTGSSSSEEPSSTTGSSTTEPSSTTGSSTTEPSSTTGSSTTEPSSTTGSSSASSKYICVRDKSSSSSEEPSSTTGSSSSEESSSSSEESSSSSEESSSSTIGGCCEIIPPYPCIDITQRPTEYFGPNCEIIRFQSDYENCVSLGGVWIEGDCGSSSSSPYPDIYRLNNNKVELSW